MFFHALTFAGSRERCLNRRLSDGAINYRIRDPASVNANMCDCYSFIFDLIPT